MINRHHPHIAGLFLGLYFSRNCLLKITRSSTYLIYAISAAFTFFGWSGVDTVRNIYKFVVDARLRLILHREFFSRNEGHLTEISLAFEPLLPSFSSVDHEVFLKPFLVLFALFLIKHVHATDLDVLLHEQEKEFNVKLVAIKFSRIHLTCIFGSIDCGSFLLRSPHAFILVQVESHFVLHSNDGNIEAVQTLIVDEILVCPLCNQEFHKDDVSPEGSPHERSAPTSLSWSIYIGSFG